MNPIPFPEQNKVLGKPESMTDEECQPMAVWTDGQQCISCWKANFRERLRFLFTGRMWASVITGTATQPPICLMPRYPFQTERERRRLEKKERKKLKRRNQ